MSHWGAGTLEERSNMNRGLENVRRCVRLAAPLLFLWASTAIAFGQPSLQITSPADGTVVNPGQPLAVTVAASGADFEMVVVVGQDPIGSAQVLSAPPYEFSIEIPSGISLRRYTLTAEGTVGPGQGADSDPISIDIERSDTPDSVTVSPSLLILRPGDPGFLFVDATYADGTTPDVTQSTQITYVSDTPAVATVTADGRVTAVGPGSANIAITYGGSSITVPVTVRQPVTVVPGSASLYPSSTEQFVAQLAWPGVTDSSVTWALDPPVGSIDSTGLYTAPSSVDSIQSLTVTATSVADNTKTGSAHLWIVPPIAVTVTPAAATLEASGTQQFTVSVVNTAYKDVTWSVTPAGTGTIDTTGVYSAPTSVAPDQTATVTATSVADHTKSASAQVTLLPTPVAISPTALTLRASQAQQFTATVGYNPGTAVTWSLSPDVGTLSSSGLYTAPAAIASQQLVTVTATSVADNTKSASAAVSLFPPISVSVSPASVVVGPSGGQYLQATVENAANTGVKWSRTPAQMGALFPTDPNRAMYVAPSLIPGEQPVTVTATSLEDNATTGSAQIALLPAFTVSVAPEMATLSALQTQQFTATVTGIANSAVTWSFWPPFGTLSDTGLYTAPAMLAVEQDVNVTATSQVDGVTSGSVTLVLAPHVSDSTTAPQGLTATGVSPAEIDLSWTASSTPAGAIVGYMVFRDGAFVGTSATTSYSDLGLLASSAHSYTVAAYDSLGNNSAPSAGASAATLSGPLAPGLVAYYKFDEAAGFVLHDLSGNGNNGYIAPPTIWTGSGRWGGALAFGGSYSGVEVPGSSSLDLSTGMTLEAWVNPASLASVVLLKESCYGLYPRMAWAGPGGVVFVGPEQFLYLPGGEPLPLNAWTHLATTYNGQTLNLYVNGVQVASGALAGTIAAAASQPLLIGQSRSYGSWQDAFDGMIDEVRVYNRALSQAEIQNDMLPPANVNVTVSPASATLSAAQTHQFTATVTGSTNTAVAWTAALGTDAPAGAEPGAVSASGLYTAPASIPSQYTVTVTAQSQADATKIASATVTLLASEAISAPAAPSGTADGLIGASYTYTASGATSSYGHSLQYRFDWGDSTNSGWLAVGTLTASHLWASAGTYQVTAQARCVTDTAVVSAPSSSLAVVIHEPVAVSVSPASATLGVSQIQQFAATVTGSSNTSVTWTAALGPDPPAGAQPGTVSASGLYTAPGSIPSPYTVLVSAQSQADTSKSATAAVTLNPPPPQVVAPTFSLAAGSYVVAPLTVTISTSTPGASVRYTTDGSQPSASVGTLYGGPVTVSATTTLTAIAYAGTMTDSPVSSASYTISPQTAPAIFTPAADTYVWSANPTYNNGTLTNLNVDSTKAAFIRFDLSALPPGTVPSHVKKATVSLYLNRFTTAGSLDITEITSPWAETTVTFNTAPSTGAVRGTVLVSTSAHWYTIDITDLVRTWVANPAANYGIRVSPSASSSASAIFDAKESISTKHAAQLQLVLDGLAPQAAAVMGADTYISNASPAEANNNYGVMALYVGGGRKALIQFDLSTLPPQTHDSDVNGATLFLWVHTLTTSGSLDVAGVSGPWGEMTVKFNNAPAAGAVESSTPVSQVGTWVSLDVTNLVKGWIANPALNYGLQVSASASSPANVNVDSKECISTSHSARLEIVLNGPLP